MVVEDEMLLALDLEMLLEDRGAEVCGPVASVEQALKLLAGTPPDAVTLDMNLSGNSSLPIAMELADRGIPSIVVSGYSDAHVKEPALRGVPFVRKPYDIRQLLDALDAVLGRPD